VDIGEVEATLVRHPGVKEAAVVAKEIQSGDSRLIAYLVPQADPPPTASSLRMFFENKLPDYMVPSTFVTLQEMPVTSTGKINRRALPEPGNLRPDLTNSYAAPRIPVEAELEGIWASVLCLTHVGIHDNFFDLGGNSLAASGLIARVAQTFQLDLPIKALFDAPTVAEMAVIITLHEAKRASETDLARMLCDVEAMTDAEAQRRLGEIHSTIVKS
jgi:hypothetical protein